MDLSLVSQYPSAATTQRVLTALRASHCCGDYFNDVRLILASHWQPGREEASILLLEGNVAWPAFSWQRCGSGLGLPVLPLRVLRRGESVPEQGADVRDPRFYVVSNGIVLEESELINPTCCRVLLCKLEPYFPLLSSLVALR